MNKKDRLFEIISNIDPKFNIPINKQLVKRISFLKEYNIFENNPDRLDAQKITENHNVTLFFGEEMVTFKQYNIVSEIHFYKHKIRENIFYNFIIKNGFYYDIPKELDNLTITIYIHAMHMVADKLTYRKEIMLNENEPFDPNTLTQVINEMNQNLFQLEEYAQKHKLKF